MKKIFEFCKMLFCGRAVSGDVWLPKSLRVELLAGRNPDKGTHYAIRFGRDPKFLVNYYVNGLTRKEVVRNLATVYALWLDVEEALLSPEAEAELLTVYGALARIDYMDHSAYVPVGALSRLALPQGSSCTRLAPDKLNGEVDDAENAANDGNGKRCPFDDCIFHAVNSTKTA